MRALALMTALAAGVALAREDEATISGGNNSGFRSLDGISGIAPLDNLHGFKKLEGGKLQKGKLTITPNGPQVGLMVREVPPKTKVRLEDPDMSRTAEVWVESGITRMAQAIGSCGPLEIAEGVKTIHCNGFELTEGRVVELRVDGKMMASKTVCTFYVVPGELGPPQTPRPGEAYCWGEHLIGASTTLDEAKALAIGASEVVAEKDGRERLRTDGLHLVFANKKLVSIEQKRR